MSNEKRKEIDISSNKPIIGPQPLDPKIDPNEPKAKINLAEEAKAAVSPADLIDLIISKDPDELLPWEKVTLPSMGCYYDGKIPNGIVEVRPMGLYADKILATARLAQTNQSLDYLFKKCVRFPSDFDPLDLLVGDRTFLLYYLRGITHGNEYEFTATCTNEACKKQDIYNYDLNELQKTMQFAKINKEPVKIMLPHQTELLGREVWVEARFMRGRDARMMLERKKIIDGASGNIARNAKNPFNKDVQPERINLDTTVEEHLNLVIVSANGVTDRHKIQQFINRIHSKDSATIRRRLLDLSPGIDTEIVISCRACGNEMKTDIPLTENFFRPSDPTGV